MQEIIIICLCSGLVIGFFGGGGWQLTQSEKEIEKLKQRINTLEKESSHKDFELEQLCTKLHKLKQSQNAL